MDLLKDPKTCEKAWKTSGMKRKGRVGREEKGRLLNIKYKLTDLLVYPI